MTKPQKENASVLEHVNITVRDAEKTAAMLCQLFDWKVRWKGPSSQGGCSVHVGTQDRYLAVYMHEREEDYPGNANKKTDALNHIGIVVEDIDVAEKRVVEAGFKPCSHADYEPGRRFYFYDSDNIEYEIVSYQSQSS